MIGFFRGKILPRFVKCVPLSSPFQTFQRLGIMPPATS